MTTSLKQALQRRKEFEIKFPDLRANIIYNPDMSRQSGLRYNFRFSPKK